jgi:hypothetical protein
MLIRIQDINENLSAAGEGGSVRHGVIINVVELLTESTINTVDCEGAPTDSHGLVVARILTLENLGAGREVEKGTPRRPDTHWRHSKVLSLQKS